MSQYGGPPRQVVTRACKLLLAYRALTAEEAAKLLSAGLARLTVSAVRS